MVALERASGSENEIRQLINLVEMSGVDVRPGADLTLGELTGLIDRWNKSVNLVSRKDIARLVSYHFCDSASLLPILKPRRDMAVLDIGGSNGLPGMVLAGLSPFLHLTVCDSKRKRRGFLDEAQTELNIAIQYEIDRADSAGFVSAYRDRFDLIVARAVTELRQLFKWCMPLLKPGGCLVAYKGSRCLEEAGRAERPLIKYGGRLLAVVGSPWAEECNPYRLFAIAVKADS
jgi:16S rRNA (guanine527-N7)-methyltransferase